MFIANGNFIGNWFIRKGKEGIAKSQEKSDFSKKMNNLSRRMRGRPIRYPEVENNGGDGNS